MKSRELREYRRIVFGRALPIALGFTICLSLLSILLKVLFPTKFHLNVGSGLTPILFLFVVLVIVAIPIILIATLGYRAETKNLFAAGQFAQSVIDALSTQLCVLDENGTVLATNNAWSRFAAANSPALHRACLGDNYLRMSAPANASDAAVVASFVAGIRTVMCGERPEFAMEYAYSTASEQQWFLGRVTPFPGDNLGRVVVAHENITERKRTEEASMRLAAIVEFSGDAIISKNLNGIVTSWNKGAQKLFGYSADEMVGTSIMRLIPADRQDEEIQILGKIKRGESVEHFETLRQTRDRRLIDVSVTVSPIRDVAGAVIGASKVARDITERRQAERSRRESEARYRTLFDYAPDGIVIADPDSYYLDVNASMCRMLGYSRGELIGLHASDIVVEAEIEYISSALKAIKSEAAYNRVWQFRRKDGSVFVAEVIATTMPDGNLLGMVRDVTERRNAEKSLRDSEDRFRELAENMQAVFWMTDPAKRQMLYVSPAYEKIWGRTRASLYESPASWASAIHPDDSARIFNAVETKQAPGQYDETYRILRPDGEVRWIHDRATPVRDAAGELQRVVGTAEDITEQRQLEEQFRQAQKMEAMGQLAGGVAHDFNNLLTIINGYTDVLLDHLGPPESIRETLHTIHQAGDRAAALTRQLLTFSRKQIVVQQVLDINTVVRGIEKMLRRVIGEDIELSTVLDSALGRVIADPGQIEQVLMNLVVNAKDAMPHGGKLTIETQNVVVDDVYGIKHYDVRSGRYSMLSITDNGCGLNEATKAHIFEPFFTTKEVGKGTGLGLSVVHGIIRQTGGHIQVYSEPNSGTVFKIYLPHSEKPEAPSASDAGRHSMPQGNETLLLAEDEGAVRTLAARILTTCGYRVLEAANGQEAIAVAEAHAGRIDLVVTDVVMPGLGGRAVAEYFARVRPESRVLFLSGYTDDTVIRHGILESSFAFLQKPFTTLGLAQKVRQVLDQSHNAG